VVAQETAAAAPAAAIAQEPAPAPAAPPSDEAWIETSRCSSCNECQNINDRLFGYNENKQAFIKDIRAGTYREMIEAAEACQVAIIHPGKPLNPNEPGLEELLGRAKPFL
jgi:ferredoxin